MERNKSPMDIYFGYTRIYMSILGIWPYQSRNSIIALRSFWIIQHISIMLPEGIKIFENRKNFDLIIESLPPFMYNTIMGIKFLTGLLKQRQLKLVLSKIKNDWNKLSDENEIEILHLYSARGKFLNMTYMSLVWIVLLSYMLIPLEPIILDLVIPLNTSRPKSTLYMVEFYIDQDKYFYSILTHAYITSLAGIIPLMASDSLFSSSAHHACGMLEILGSRIKNVSNKETVMKGLDEKKAIACVAEHQRIIKYCNIINLLYSASFTLILSICIVGISVTGLAVVIKINEDFNDFIRFAMFTVAQAFHLFCYNFVGQQILNHGEKLKDYTWDNIWYKTSSKTKYIIKFMLMRTMKPNKVMAIIFPLTLENFTSVMKTAMSYFAVIKSTR